MTLEVLIPVRNPTEVFGQTIDSLVAQTDKNFTVLLSDNFSTSGAELIRRALEKLAVAGIAARKIQPPLELERVEHWNWLHYQSAAEWLKPLFAGDWLEPAYMARLRATVLAEPACRYVFANGFTHFLGASPHSSPNCWTGRFNPPAVMQAVVLRVGMQFGPPSAAAYERTAFISLGGYATHLPIVADSLLFCSLAARFGVARISELLVHFKPTSDSYSTLSGWRRKYLNEAVTYWTFLSYYLWTDQGSFRIGWLLRRITSETKNYLFRH